ncbi:aminotransferase class IV family protein [Phycicoccus endophyticus]|uniref:Aminotransferase class IV family protein n=1 Tax=Phycicoccus endophyticus TaxID=1690220 RepID=A0A7G9R4R3_9MICO|nr:aminotransferase class IV [Phycicoccus endophyticus]NHI18504.1 4-amino-4-deoxychorismate lyase [Phycicoccus endophyticus]QNN50588.1 aminotransferase class IV family protein [Phycicoccus endophyticus]GGL23225.1 4-amino-4-deoxychorismate lyase [Phycicoccus endophyticus]
MSEVRVWVDGARVAPDEPALSALDHGVTVGDGVFETAKVDGGEAFALSRHLARLDRSMAGLGLPAADHDRVREGIAAVLAGEPIPFGRLRWTVTAGRGPLGSDRQASRLTYVVTAVAHDPPPPSGAAVTVPWVRNERSATAGLKTTSYAENVVALARAHEQGALEALFANTRGELCEGTGSNVFVVTGGVLRTPPVESGCLAGITRELVLQWCRAEALEVREETLPLEVLAQAEEVFLTSSVKDVLPVSVLDGRELAAPGPVTTAVREIWATHAARTVDP